MWLITGLALGSMLTMGSFTRLCADGVKSQLWSHIAFPGSVPLLAGPPPPHNTVTDRAPVKLLGGSHVEALQFHSNTQSHWSSGSTVCFLSRGISGLHPQDAQTHNGTGFLLLAMSRYTFLFYFHALSGSDFLQSPRNSKRFFSTQNSIEVSKDALFYAVFKSIQEATKKFTWKWSKAKNFDYQ